MHRFVINVTLLCAALVLFNLFNGFCKAVQNSDSAR